MTRRANVRHVSYLREAARPAVTATTHTSPPSHLLIELGNDEGPAGFTTTDLLRHHGLPSGTFCDRIVCALYPDDAGGKIPLRLEGTGNASKLTVDKNSSGTILGYIYPKDSPAADKARAPVQDFDLSEDGKRAYTGEVIGQVGWIPQAQIDVTLSGGKVGSTVFQTGKKDLDVDQPELILFNLDLDTDNPISFGGITVHPRDPIAGTRKFRPANPKGEFGIAFYSASLVAIYDRDESRESFDYRVVLAEHSSDGKIRTYVQSDPNIKNQPRG